MTYMSHIVTSCHMSYSWWLVTNQNGSEPQEHVLCCGQHLCQGMSCEESKRCRSQAAKEHDFGFGFSNSSDFAPAKQGAWHSRFTQELAEHNGTSQSEPYLKWDMWRLRMLSARLLSARLGTKEPLKSIAAHAERRLGCDYLNTSVARFG